MDVPVYDAVNAVFDESELSLTELPEIPQWFSDTLTEAGGTTHEHPNVRVVSGLDPDMVEFVGGRFWKKYAFREHKVKEFAILHQPDGKKRVMTKAEGEVWNKSNKLKGIITFQVERDVIEHGVPRYFVEAYKPPEYYGSPEAWETVRWYQDDDSGKLIDLMGEFPSQGEYETWFCIEQPVLKDGVIVSTKFRPLDEIVLEFIKLKIEDAKTKSAAEQHIESRTEIDADYIDKKKKVKDGIRDIVADRADRLIV